ncbi:MAG: type I DNA topoisomerase [Bacteroidia bacterium]
MAKNLLIVESPAKAKTIEKYLGKDFIVKSSIGHIVDLPEKGLGVDIKHDFKPDYVVSSDKKKVVSELKKLAKSAEMVWLATDEDREGEAIAWHLYNELGLDEKKTKRVVYHEITKSAIEEAIKHPRKINKDLVDAQQARRILDRLVGYELSPILWRKIKPALSAGRVQSVAVRVIVEREREITAFAASSFFKVVGYFASGSISFKAELDKKFNTEAEANEFLKKLAGTDFFVKNQEKKPSKRTPSAPFTTSTLQQEASRKLSFSVLQTMRVAQSLYERGDITYMRTDSVNLSQFAIDAAKEEIVKVYGEKYSQTRQYKTKSSSAQEAHEAIRPTNFSAKETTSEDYNEQRLYELIWKRTVASQMADAEIEKTIITIGNKATENNFIATGEVIKFDGFLKVYIESDDESEEEETEGQLPMLQTNDKVNLSYIDAIQRFTQPPSRYTEASLVKKLEGLGIGRPSTYAPTISTVQKRGYVVKENREGNERKYNVLTLKNGGVTSVTRTEITGAEKSKLFPTDVGMVVNDFLVDHFGEILDYNFTAHVEEEFDIIADGKLKWTKMLHEFYNPFHSTVEKTSAVKERASGEKLLGKDPNGKNVFVKIGRYGPMVQIGDTDSEEKPRFAKLRGEQRLDSITLEQALELFRLPRKAGIYEGKDMDVSIGRFGPYIKHDGQFYSLPKEDDPYTVTEARAIEVIEEKRKKEREKVIQIIKHEPEIKVLNGRYGPYITMEKEIYKIPKDKEPAKLTLEECLSIIEADKASGKKKRRFTPRKKS